MHVLIEFWSAEGHQHSVSQISSTATLVKTFVLITSVYQNLPDSGETYAKEHYKKHKDMGFFRSLF